MTPDEILEALRDIRTALLDAMEQAAMEDRAEALDGYRTAKDRVAEAIEDVEWAAKQ